MQPKVIENMIKSYSQTTWYSMWCSNFRRRAELSCELKPWEKILMLEERTRSLNPCISCSRPLLSGNHLNKWYLWESSGKFSSPNMTHVSLMPHIWNCVHRKWGRWVRDNQEGLCRNYKWKEERAYLHWNTRGNLRKAQPRLGSIAFGNPVKAVRSQNKCKIDTQQSATYLAVDQQFDKPWPTDYLPLLPPELGPYARGTKM